MRYIFLVVVLFLFSFNSFANQCSEKRPEILFIMPTDTSDFWANKAILMHKSAKKLGIRLTVYSPPLSAQNRFAFTDEINHYLSTHKHPDFIISYLWLKSEENFIAMLDSFKIPFISINSNIDEHNDFFGQPREKYQYWLSHISPDDFSTGYDLIEKLVLQTTKTEKSTINVLAIGGRRDSSSSQARKYGLENYLDNHKDIKLLQYVNTDWSSKDAFNKATILLKRFPDIDIIWAANDTIATGASDAVKAQKSSVKNKPVIGGVDWLPTVLPKIQSKQIALSLGGHMFDGVWAQVLLYDFFNGKDFISDTGNIIKTNMVEINPKNIYRMSKVLHPSYFQNLNIKQYSKCHTPTVQQYNFQASKLF